MRSDPSGFEPPKDETEPDDGVDWNNTGMANELHKKRGRDMIKATKDTGIFVATLLLSEGVGKLIAKLAEPVSEFIAARKAVAMAKASTVATKASAAEQLVANKTTGDAFRDEVANAFVQAGRTVRKEVVKKTPFGPRVIDVEVSSNGKVLGGIECKTGGSRYTPSQRAKDWWLTNVDHYPVNLMRRP